MRWDSEEEREQQEEEEEENGTGGAALFSSLLAEDQDDFLREVPTYCFMEEKQRVLCVEDRCPLKIDCFLKNGPCLNRTAKVSQRPC